MKTLMSYILALLLVLNVGSTHAQTYVTNLNDSGEGSLRWALAQGDNQHIILAVGGTVALQSQLEIDGAFNLLINGLLVPAPGFTITNYGIRIEESSSIHIVNLRIRDVAGDGVTVKNGSSAIILQHVSITDYTDGAVDVTQDSSYVYVAHSILGPGSLQILYSQNLFIGGENRNPQISWDGAELTTPLDVVANVQNNTICNFGTYGSLVVKNAHANFLNNYLSGPTTDPDEILRVRTGGKVYADGNVSAEGANVDSMSTENTPFALFTGGPLLDPYDAVVEVILLAGTHPRDTIDKGFLKQVIFDCTSPIL